MNEVRVEKFSLKDTIECGQTFCWTRMGDGYVSADFGQVIYVEQRGNRLLYQTSHENISIQKLFRLDDPIEIIHTEIAKDKFMRDCIQYAPGLRIVSDPFFPSLVSFLCTIWNNIPRARLLIQRIRERFGKRFEFLDRSYYGMPEPEILANANLQELRELGLAWRATFIKKASQAICELDIQPANLKKNGYFAAREQLKSLQGVGDKVADCVCLFALGFLEAFPIDIWIKRAIVSVYKGFLSKGRTYWQIAEAARKYFGRFAGYAQQYIFHYLRNKCKVTRHLGQVGVTEDYHYEKVIKNDKFRDSPRKNSEVFT